MSYNCFKTTSLANFLAAVVSYAFEYGVYTRKIPYDGTNTWTKPF
jgi:hypothetical protein